MEDHILNKIGERLDFIYDSSSVELQITYDARNRIPRLTKYLSRLNNMWVTTEGCVENMMMDMGNDN